MGNRGKIKEQERARALRAQNRTLADIAQTLGVSKSSVSLWVRDVPFTPSRRRYGSQRRRQPLRERKVREIEELNREGVVRIGALSDGAFFIAGVALYAGEGAKADALVKFANSDPEMVRFFCPGSVGFSRSTKHGFAARSTFIKVLTLKRQNHSGQTSRGYRAGSSGSRIAPCQIQASAETSTSTAAST